MKASINGFQMAYTDTGRGTPLLLVHGYPLNRTMWDAQVLDLSKDFRVIAVDLRGHGESDAPAGAHGMDLYADDLKALLDHLHIDRVVFCGLSMGGYVAFAFSRKYSPWMQALVLADTRAQPDTPEAKQGRMNSAETALKEGIASIADAFAPRTLSPANVQARPELLSRVLGIMRSTSVNGYVGDLRGIGERPDSVPTLANITCPTLVIVGEQDALTPPADAQLMAKGIKGAKLVTIANSGHLSPMEQPAAFDDAVRGFVKGLSK